jgi:hypothetical protein
MHHLPCLPQYLLPPLPFGTVPQPYFSTTTSTTASPTCDPRPPPSRVSSCAFVFARALELRIDEQPLMCLPFESVRV